MTTIVTVLRSGGEYRPEHVERLYRQCAGHSFLCLSDVDLSVPFLRMEHNWPTWFGKIEAFKLPGPILMMDLDTTITGDISPLLRAAQEHEFIATRNPMATPSKLASSMVGWRGDVSHVYRRFLEAPMHHIRRCTTRQVWGDQGFIAEDYPTPVFWDDLFPEQVLSWKVHCQKGIPDTARVVYFHGKPRPWDVGH